MNINFGKITMGKNILILNDNHHSNIGGTETYTRKIIEILTEKNHKVFEINFLKQKNYFKEKIKNYEHINHKIEFSLIKSKNIYSIFLIFKFLLSTWKFCRLINKTVKTKKISVVIDNTVKSIPYIKKKKVDYIWVAHFDIIKLYNEEQKNKFIKRLAIRQNKFKYRKIVVFTEKDKNELIKKNKKMKSENIFTCPLAHKNLSEINSFSVFEKIDNAKNIVYIGRIDQNQKNIEFIKKIAEKLINSYIYIYIWRRSWQKYYS